MIPLYRLSSQTSKTRTFLNKLVGGLMMLSTALLSMSVWFKTSFNFLIVGNCTNIWNKAVS